MARIADWLALERASPILAALPQSLRRVARLAEIAKSGRLFCCGDRPKAMYCIVSGEVHLIRHALSEGEIVLQRGRGGFVAEASFDQAAYHCDAVAVAASEVLILPRKAFCDALADQHFRARWIGHLARELRRVRTHAERLSLKAAPDRIIHYIATEGDNGRVVLSQSKKDWAAELGLSHEALYRALARMNRAGQIKVDGASVTVRGGSTRR